MPESLERKRIVCGGACAPGSSAGRGVAIIYTDRRLLRGQYSQVAESVGGRLKNFDLHDHFRLGLIDVVDHFLHEHQFVRSIADNERILRIHLLNPLQIKQLPQPGLNFR